MDYNFLSYLPVIGLGYFLGSLPYGLILVKLFYGIDIRTIGSKNIGATNVLRAGYKSLALLTLLMDAGKGALAVYLTKYIMNLDASYYSIAGFGAMLGHIYPVWLKFKGGRGVATFFGIILAFNPLIFLISGLSWLTVAFIFRYSSLAAIVAIIVSPIAIYFLDNSIFIICLFISILVILRHKDNIQRLLRKEETKITFKKQR